MLRQPLYAARRQGVELIGARIISRQSIGATGLASPRYYANLNSNNSNTKKSIADPQPVILPGSASTTTTKGPRPPAPGPIASVSPASSASLSAPTPATPSSASTIPPENVPLVPPPPPTRDVPITPPTKPTPSSAGPAPPATPPPPTASSTPPPRRRKPGRLRRFFTSILLLTGFSYGLGIYYSLVNDNFHDFFTEYIPFAEDAVFYFEERQFRRRFPNASTRTLSHPRHEGNHVTIPSGSGMSWRLAQEDARTSPDLSQKGPHNSALEGAALASSPAPEAKQPLQKAAEPAKAAKKPKPKDDPPPPAPEPPKSAGPLGGERVQIANKEEQIHKQHENEKVVIQEKERAVEKEAPTQTFKVEPKIPPIELLKVPDAEEPIVQDMVKSINNIITVINADHASNKYSPAIEDAKAHIAQIGRKILAVKEQAVEEKLRATHSEFDQAAKELVRRLEEEMVEQESRWQDDFESERKRIAESYDEKLKTELNRAKEIYDQQVRNELLEQAIQLKRQFASEVQDQVEKERDGRLGKLTELSQSVDQLEDLTTGWNDVVDASLKTQHLAVAVDAVRSILEDVQQPRPFIRELAALRETASDDPVVRTAIETIDPGTYRYGIPSSAQLIDRFRRVSSEVRKAALLPEHAGAASHAASVVLSKVLFKKQGLAVGDDVESVLTRAEALLEEGDLDGAAREMNSLTGWAKTLSKDWLADVRKVLEVQQALEVITAEARLRSLQVEA
ncbi:MAG: Formation of crista junctions protein 1 [Watsoniomyces obsoletus]|nr:MAG: Formation of crista junctions protein 1 [Watsoniomyces obsoletus]